MKTLAVSTLCFFAIPAFAADVAAADCEVFVDRVVVSRGSVGTTTVRMFIKVNSERLDAPVKSVGVVHRHGKPTNRIKKSDFKYDTLQPYMARSDYFEFSSVTGDDWLAFRDLASFVVETTNGTKYWLNSGNKAGVDFVLDNSFVYSLTRYANGQTREDAVNVYVSDVGSAPQTADYPADLAGFLNPERCR